MSKGLIKVNDRFAIKKTTYCWNCVEFTEGVDQKGKPRINERQTYHPDLKLVAKHITEKMGYTVDNLDNLIEAYDRHCLKMEKYLKGLVNEG